MVYLESKEVKKSPDVKIKTEKTREKLSDVKPKSEGKVSFKKTIQKLLELRKFYFLFKIGME